MVRVGLLAEIERAVDALSPQLGQAEIENLGQAFRRDHHVGRFQVAVDDADAVGGGQRVGDLHGDLQAIDGGHACRAAIMSPSVWPRTNSITMQSPSPRLTMSWMVMILG